MYHIICSHKCIQYCAQKRTVTVQKITILDRPVSCVYCKHPGEERATVANSGCCGLMIWAASRRARNALCVLASFAYSMNRIKDVCDEQCLPHEYAQGNVLLAFWFHLGLSCTAVFFLLLPPCTGYFLHLWPLQNKPQLICLNVLKETGKWRREEKHKHKHKNCWGER